MNITAYCLATLSKKLEKICQEGPIFLSISALQNNKGVAQLKIVCPDGVNIESIKQIGQTSIMLSIEDAVEDIKEIGNEVPVQNLYPSDEKVPNTKMAITNPDEEIKKYKEVDRYPVNHPKKSDKNGRGNFIGNYEDLVKVLSAVNGIENPLPTPPTKNGKMSRQEAAEWGKTLATIPKVPCGVYISNETQGKLCIDDLEIYLSANEIKDISSIPAALLKNSSQLRQCCQRMMVKFRSKGEFEEYVQKSTDAIEGDGDSYAVFDRHDDISIEDEGSPAKKTAQSRFTEEKHIAKPAEKSKKEMLITPDVEEARGVTEEVDADYRGEEEEMLEKLAQNLPKDDGDKIQPAPRLLSDEVKSSDRPKIRRLG